ncbi:fumarylacetoacetate hydrolase family protein [Erwiniaceae bacterium BAC15a-03b]|uniref:Fumarylacetoacetate hydrolase family protein n=1 Tax=Winslowiella arboricola TaxID=2978220 RepID=A0A9J6PQE1_9GAMM|nr:fumarylacetoacetate hydrolase family protein [Winslowiella arboricola]MCU5775016.1 fumarylacetoacetate hydrolase family protein [Winslowiella arboricola]MCU5780529.1 fumarylacetoacetate hydrolase family protein [Winslowiella arboricola]
MKLLSYIKPDGVKSYGIITEKGIIDLRNKTGLDTPDLKNFIRVKGVAAARQYLSAPVDFRADEIIYLPVIENPGKILCVGMNYQAKREEFGASTTAPTIFIRFSDSQTAHLNEIVKPSFTEQLDYEGELVLIIGKAGLNISAEDACNHIAGYSCYMDGSVRDWQYTWFTAGKNWSKTGGFGPWLVTPDETGDPQNLNIKTLLNGEIVQNENTSQMIHPVSELISYISTFTQLSPGDVILTGSPGGVGHSRTPPLYLKKGDVIEVEIESIGRLTNTVVGA